MNRESLKRHCEAMCKKFKDVSTSGTYGEHRLVLDLLEQTEWIPCSERLPKESEYVGNVCKYYLVQDEYGDMHVAHYKKIGWIPMRSLKALGDEVVAWMPLPKPYKAEMESGE